MIAVSGLVKRFGYKTVLRDLDFNAAPGEWIALLGHNGSGKTTFLRILAGLSRPSAGSVSVAGCALPGQNAALRGKLGLVSHQLMLYPALTADENLRFFGRLHHLPDLNQRIEAELRRADLWSRRRDPARIFSRGMQQRLSIARALLPSPSLLLLDEPYTGLDPDSARTLDATLRQVVADGCTVIFTSHDWLRSVELASRVDVLAGGRMAISLPVEGLPLPELLQTLQEAAAQ